ncbi:MAG: DUF2071 domain-containing protein, partial [Planctomycetaceae bacterium]
SVAVSQRAEFICQHPLLWRLGWLTWQLTALSDLLLSLALVAYFSAAAPRTEAANGLLWAIVGLVATVLAIVPEQWAEFRLVTTFVQQACALTNASIEPAVYLATEARWLLLTGTCGNTGYTLMGCCWMLAAVQAAGGPRRHVGFVVLGCLLWLLFLVASAANWQATIRADLQTGYPGFWLVYSLNAIGFPLLLLWMVWLGAVIGDGHHRRHPADDAALHRLRWPTRGAADRVLTPLANAAGLRDLIRSTARIVPVPVMASDITDVVYLNWLVPAERVAGWLPAPLKLHCLGNRTFVSLLTYRHGHFGPRFLGPMRCLMPSACQTNWRLYVEPVCADEPRDAIYFFKTALDHSGLAVASRLMADGLPSHRPLRIDHTRSDDRLVTWIEPGVGSGPDLKSTVRISEQRELPTDLAEHFSDWEQLVRYLVDQNRGSSVHPAQSGICQSKISIPIAIEAVQPAAVVGTVESRLLAPVIDGCRCFAFVVPQVSFLALGETWTELDSVLRVDTQHGA